MRDCITETITLLKQVTPGQQLSSLEPELKRLEQQIARLRHGEQVVLVVGGAGGIGAATAEEFYHHGFRVVIADRDKAAGKRVVKAFPGMKYEYVDVLDSLSIEELFKRLQQQEGYLHRLLSLAGNPSPLEGKGLLRDVTHVPVDAVCESVNLNLTAHILLTKAAIPLLRKAPHKRGEERAIAYISSINAITGIAHTAYSAAKAGLMSLAQTQAKDLGKYGVRAMTILPGTVQTPRTMSGAMKRNRTGNNVEGLNATVSLIHNGTPHFTSPHDVAALILALTSNPSVSGVSCVIDSGQSANWRFT